MGQWMSVYETWCMQFLSGTEDAIKILVPCPQYHLTCPCVASVRFIRTRTHPQYECNTLGVTQTCDVTYFFLASHFIPYCSAHNLLPPSLLYYYFIHSSFPMSSCGRLFTFSYLPSSPDFHSRLPFVIRCLHFIRISITSTRVNFMFFLPNPESLLSFWIIASETPLHKVRQVPMWCYYSTFWGRFPCWDPFWFALFLKVSRLHFIFHVCSSALLLAQHGFRVNRSVLFELSLIHTFFQYRLLYSSSVVLCHFPILVCSYPNGSNFTTFHATPWVCLFLSSQTQKYPTSAALFEVVHYSGIKRSQHIAMINVNCVQHFCLDPHGITALR